jgi:putative toxin-antitoxin system antitoxin component (TIGR02293 family)
MAVKSLALGETLGITYSLDNPLILVETIRKGLPTKVIAALASCLNMPISALEHVLPVSHRTLQRYEKEDRALPQELSDHVVQVAKIFIRAEEVFGSREKARKWLKEPCVALGSNTPIEMMDTFSGVRMIEDELGRIEYGVYA